MTPLIEIRVVADAHWSGPQIESQLRGLQMLIRDYLVAMGHPCTLEEITLSWTRAVKPLAVTEPIPPSTLEEITLQRAPSIPTTTDGEEHDSD